MTTPSWNSDTWVWLSGPGVPQGETGMTVIIGMPVFPVERTGTGELRHLSFDDPPEGMPAERFEQLVRGHARETKMKELFVDSMLRGLGSLLVYGHDCDPAKVEEGVRAFAERIWKEEHKTRRLASCSPR